jgi:biotin carboxylase
MSTTPPTLILVESNTTGSGRMFCRRARARGLRPVVLARDPHRYAYLAADGIDTEVLDTTDLAAVLGFAERAGVSRIAGITSSSEYYAAMAAAAAGALGLPGPDAGAVGACRDKAVQRAVLADHGVAVPGVRPVADPDEAVAAAQALGFPVVVKPRTGSGSEGVRLCADAAEVRAWTRRLVGPLLVEEYVTGPEYSIETIDLDVVAVVTKLVSAPPYFVELGHDLPGTVPGPVRAGLAATAQAALVALGLGWGAAHTEVRMSPRGPVVIEVNPRLAGGMIPALVQAVTGTDLIDTVVARVSGLTDPPAAAPADPVAGAIRFLLAPGPGRVRAVDGVAAASRLAGIVAAESTMAPGQSVTITHSFRDRAGYVIATGPDQAGAAARADAAIRRIRIDVDSPVSAQGVAS